MSKTFITICNDCKFLSGPQRGIDKWVSCECGHISFFSSRDITSGKWSRFENSVVPDEWRVTTDQTIVFVLKKRLVAEIKATDMEWSDNEDEEDGEVSNNVEDFSSERIMYAMDNGDDSDISDSDTFTSDSDTFTNDSDSDYDSDSDSDYDSDSDSDSDTFTSDSDSEGFGEWDDEVEAFERENPFEHETDTDYSADTDSEDEEERRMRDYFNTVKRPTN